MSAVRSTVSEACACPTLADVFRARRRIAPYLRATPVLEPEALCESLGFRAVLKCEHLNPTGAFKVRGGVNLLAAISAQERSRGVIAASTGNHAQSVAHAARLFGVPAVIYMPEAANPLKAAATRALGAQVVLTGRDFDEARREAEAHAEREGLRYVHSIEPLLIEGVATAALELFEAVPDLDVIVVPVGGGSGVIGAGVVARAVNPAIQVIGVQAEGAPAVYRSWKEGRRVVTDSVRTFAEGLATREPFALTLALLPRMVDEMMLVSDEEMVQAIRALIETSRQVAEGAGAAALAAAMRHKREWRDKKVGLMLSGGNITADQLRRILSSQLEHERASYVI
jgi:threonine dehydratase